MTPAEQLLEAAAHARRAATTYVELGSVDEADELTAAIRHAESILRTATAAMRQSMRPRTVSGFGESHDRMRDAWDRLVLSSELLDVEDGPDARAPQQRPRLRLIARGGADGEEVTS